MKRLIAAVAVAFAALLGFANVSTSASAAGVSAAATQTAIHGKVLTETVRYRHHRHYRGPRVYFSYGYPRYYRYYGRPHYYHKRRYYHRPYYRKHRHYRHHRRYH